MQLLAAKITFGKLRLFVGYSLLPLGILCRLTNGEPQSAAYRSMGIYYGYPLPNEAPLA